MAHVVVVVDFGGGTKVFRQASRTRELGLVHHSILVAPLCEVRRARCTTTSSREEVVHTLVFAFLTTSVREAINKEKQVNPIDGGRARAPLATTQVLRVPPKGGS